MKRPENGGGRSSTDRPNLATANYPNTKTVAVRLKGMMLTAHEYRMSRIAREIAWLEDHEHWWLRQLRWEQEKTNGVAA